MIGPEFRKDCAKKASATRAFYGLKSAGASLVNPLADCVNISEYTLCLAHQYIWLKSDASHTDGHQ